MAPPSEAGRIVGAMKPPANQTANFVDPPNQNASIIALNSVLITVATLSVGLRIYTRASVLRQFGWDDAFCLAGWALAIGSSAIILKARTLGLGYHLWDVPVNQVVPFGKWMFIWAVESYSVWLMIKLAFFWSYRRMFYPRKDAQWLCYIGAFVCIAFYLAATLHDIFKCNPVQKSYNPKIPGHCLPDGVGGSVGGIFNVISDIYILVLPMPFVWSLQMKLRLKLRLMGLFAVGGFINACSITRLVLVYWWAPNPDVSWKFAIGDIWVALEMYVGLICFSALTLPASLERIIRPSWTSLRSKSSATLTLRSKKSMPKDIGRSDTLVHDGSQHTESSETERNGTFMHSASHHSEAGLTTSMAQASHGALVNVVV